MKKVLALLVLASLCAAAAAHAETTTNAVFTVADGAKASGTASTAEAAKTTATAITAGAAKASATASTSEPAKTSATTSDGTRVVGAAHLTIADVVPDAPALARGVEIGPAPAPGASRIVARDEIVRSLRRAGVSASFPVPLATRITRAATHLSSRMLADLSRPSIASALPSGVTVVHVEATSDFTAPEGTHIGRATLPKLPKTVGTFHTTANVELLFEDEKIAQIPIAVVVDISDAAAAPELRKGSKITVIVERETLSVATEATLTKDCDVGDVTSVTLSATGRTVRAKITSRKRAELAP